MKVEPQDKADEPAVSMECSGASSSGDGQHKTKRKEKEVEPEHQGLSERDWYLKGDARTSKAKLRRIRRNLLESTVADNTEFLAQRRQDGDTRAMRRHGRALCDLASLPCPDEFAKRSPNLPRCNLQG